MVSGGPRRITVLNIVKIGLFVAEILQCFEFSRWRPSTILDLFGAYLDHPQWVLLGLYHSAKFGYDQCSIFYNDIWWIKMNIYKHFNIGAFGWKTPIHTPKIGVFGQFDSLNGLQYQRKPKRHTLAWFLVIWTIKRENVVSGLTC